MDARCLGIHSSEAGPTRRADRYDGDDMQCSLLPTLVLLAAPTAWGQEPAEEAQPPEPPQAKAPELDPALVTWYQDMRLACGDKRTAIVARHHTTQSHEPGALVGHSVWADMARSGLVSWQAAGDPRVNDGTLARTPEPADYRPLDARSSTASPELYSALPAELTGRLQAIELAQGQADTAWRAWQEQPGEAERAALVTSLEALQGMCSGVE